MKPELLAILQHALGLDEYGRGEACRNHFCAGVSDEPLCRELVDMGYMYVFRPNASPYPYYNVAVTSAGKEAVRRESPTPPKLTRSQQRYRDWLNSSAGDCGITFGMWIKEGK